MKKIPGWPNFSKEEIQSVSRVLSSNKVNYWTGEECKEFEREFSEWTGANFSIAVSNGTVALDLALIALGICSSDEVIVTPRSFIASASSVANIGAKPIFSDVDCLSGNITASHIEEKITKKTKAIICVHLGGFPCEMDEIMKLAKKYNLFVIEDCAQAHGAVYKGKSVGTIGDVGAWSFCQDKIMTTGGEGGMVTTNNKKLWKLMQSYKDHGKNFDSIKKPSKKIGFRWIHDSFGNNFRMTEMQAAIGRIQLRKMQEWNRIRNRNAKMLINTLSKFPRVIEIPELPRYMHHAFYRVYAKITPNTLKKSWSRDRIIKEINLEGVPCFSGSCPEIYMEKAFINSSLTPKRRLNNAKILGETSLAFLCHPNLRLRDVQFIQKIIEQTIKKASC